MTGVNGIVKKQNYLLMLMMALLVLGLCGCTDSDSRVIVDEKYIEAELQERYGIEFVCDSVKYSQHMYKAMCHPKDDSSLSFSCMYGEDGSFGYDYFVGKIIAKEEETYFSRILNESLDQCFVRGAYAMIIDDGYKDFTEGNTEICELIKEDNFSFEKAYEISPINGLSFYIYLNESNIEIGYDDEYDILENVVHEIVSKYHDIYKLDIYVDMVIYYLSAEDYEKVYEYYIMNKGDINDIQFENYLIQMQMGVPMDNVTQDLWLSKDEYAAKREDINK